MTFLGMFRILGGTIAVCVGIFRLWKNHLRGEERTIYILSTLTVAFFVYVFITTEFNLLDPTRRLELYQLGWPFLIVTLVSFMLFYRRLPKGNMYDIIRDDN